MDEALEGAEQVSEAVVTGDPRTDLLADLQELHAEAKADHWLDLPIPAYKNLLWARFVPFPVEKTEAKIREFQRLRGQPMLLMAACDTLIDSCEQLMLLPRAFGGGTDTPDIGDKGKNLIPIDDTAVPAIGFDSRLEPIFNIDNPTKTARGVVTGLFPTEQAVISMNVRVSNWMGDVTRETDEDLLGN